MHEKAKDPPRTVVLVVEDEALIRMDAVQLLQEHGFSVLEAENAAAALKLLAEHAEIGVLFTDLHMPGNKTGLDLCREAYVMRPEVLLLITSATDYLHDDVIPDHGHFIAKPYSPVRLIAMVRSIITEHAA